VIFEMRFENRTEPHPDDAHIKRMGGQCYYLDDGALLVVIPNATRLYPLKRKPYNGNVYDEWMVPRRGGYAFRMGEAMDVAP